MYLIEGALEVMNSRNKKFYRWVDTSKIVLESFTPPSGWTVSASEQIEQRCFIKRRFDAGYASGLSFNPFLTAWELVPLSFVIDWFVNIGDFAAAQLTAFSPQRWNAEGSTFSWKVDCSVKLTHIDSKASVTHDTTGYKRIVISPSLYCDFPWTPKMTNYRYYDSLALSWSIALKRLLK